MSGDETEGEEKTWPAVFRQVDAEWMSKELILFFHRLDDIYREDWASPIGKERTSGNTPRVRLPSAGRVANTIAPKGLPRNCYNPSWLAKLKPYIIDELDIDDELHDFTIKDD